MPNRSSASPDRALWTGTRIVKKELRERGLRPSKRRGQHFLVSARFAQRIVDACGPVESESVVEIGAGLGALTVPLSRTGARVHAIEVDEGLAEILDEKMMGVPDMVNKGFGVCSVYGLRRVPKPAERIIAFIIFAGGCLCGKTTKASVQYIRIVGNLFLVI